MSINKEVGRWHDVIIFESPMKKYMMKWMLTNQFDVDNQDDGEHNYFNYALDKHLVSVSKVNGLVWHIDLAPNGREWLDGQF
jgi:hypothetical protein